MSKTKKCSRCKEVKPHEKFYQNKKQKGKVYPICKNCRSEYGIKHRRASRQKDPLRYFVHSIVNQTKFRAKRSGIKHEITHQDIYHLFERFGDSCPCCGRQFNLTSNDHKQCPSLDQIIPGEGYTTGNTTLLCGQCNTVKNGMTLKQAHYFLKLMESVTDDSHAT